VGQKEFFYIIIIIIHYFKFNASGQMAFNVPAVTDVFLRPIKKNAEHFYGRKKMWRSKTTQRA